MYSVSDSGWVTSDSDGGGRFLFVNIDDSGVVVRSVRLQADVSRSG
jgi:hypothetical protein